jgi:uncharacterized membrane protein YqjE
VAADEVWASPPSLGELLARLARQASVLLRDEWRLFEAEVSQKAGRVVPVLALFALGMVGIVFGLLCLGSAAVLGLSLVLPAWAAALVVGAVALAGAGVAWSMARRKLLLIDLRPHETLRSLKEGTEWLDRLA